jgi:hypothetical protein
MQFGRMKSTWKNLMIDLVFMGRIWRENSMESDSRFCGRKKARQSRPGCPEGQRGAGEIWSIRIRDTVLEKLKYEL